MYVDDVIGVLMEENFANDLRLTRDICMSLLSTSAVANNKMKSGRRVDIIGYVVEYNSHLQSNSLKNAMFIITF